MKAYTFARVLALAGAFVLPARPAMSAEPYGSLADYVHTQWAHHDGLPLANPEEILQSADGYLWIITRDEGLLRFDGMRFVPVPFPCDHPIINADAAPDGSIWAICGPRLLRRTARGEVVEVPQTFLPPARLEPTLRVDSRGRLWVFGRFDGYYRLYRVDADATNVKEFDRQGERRVTTWAEDSEGAIWVSDARRVLRIRDNHVETVPLQHVSALTRAPAGGVFASTEGAVWRLHSGTPRMLARAPQGVSFGNFDRSMAATADGGLWIGTRQHGVALAHADGRIELPSDMKEMHGFVTAVLVDREDTIWVGAGSGLHRFRTPRARVLSSLARRLPGVPAAVFVDSRDALWVTAQDVLVRMNPSTGALQQFTGSYDAIAEDKAGRLWLASNDDVGYLDGNRFVPVRDHAGAQIRDVYAFKRDTQGELWALSEDVGLYQVTPMPPRRVFSVPRAASDFVVSPRYGSWIGLDSHNHAAVRQQLPGRAPVVHDLQAMRPGAYILTIEEFDDAIWIGTGRGLMRWRHDRWTIWTRDHGLPGQGRVFEISTDPFGRVWLMTSGGIIALPRAQLDATPDGAPRTLTFARIGPLDRVIAHVGGMRPSPRVSADRHGQLYFATVDSVAVVDTAGFSHSSLAPSIAIESVTADNQPVDSASAARARLVEPSRMQFEYTSLSLRSPENIRFRYKLEGYDANWIEAGGQRRVTYGTLKPGTYRFRVIGSGSEGVWNDKGAAVTFQIVPSFWHTWWFGAMGIGLAAAALLGAHRLRMRRLTRQLKVQFEAQLAERMRIAQDLHDTLLQSAAVASLHVAMADAALSRDVSSATSAADDVRPSLKFATEALSGMNAEGRALVQGLRAPSASSDLAEALRQVARDQQRHADIDFCLHVEGQVRPLNPPIGEDVYRIAREALVNAYQHANARRIDVDLAFSRSRFRCVVRDDGCGIDTGVLQHGREGHWGLTGMRERAERIGAELHVRSVEGGGSEVELRIKGRLAFGDGRLTGGIGHRLRRRWLNQPNK